MSRSTCNGDKSRLEHFERRDDREKLGPQYAGLAEPGFRYWVRRAAHALPRCRPCTVQIAP